MLVTERERDSGNNSLDSRNRTLREGSLHLCLLQSRVRLCRSCRGGRLWAGEHVSGGFAISRSLLGFRWRDLGLRDVGGGWIEVVVSAAGVCGAFSQV